MNGRWILLSVLFSAMWLALVTKSAVRPEKDFVNRPSFKPQTVGTAAIIIRGTAFPPR